MLPISLWLAYRIIIINGCIECKQSYFLDCNADALCILQHNTHGLDLLIKNKPIMYILYCMYILSGHIVTAPKCYYYKY